MLKKSLLFCFVFIAPLTTKAQNWNWAETAGGILPDEANGCAIDQSGNMYMCGFFYSTSISFNSGNSMSNSGTCEGFVVKYNASGSSAWASRIKGSGEDKATKCEVDLNGNVIATGYFNSPSLQFGGNNAQNISNFDNSGNSFSCFIVKYNAAGTPQWWRAIGKADDDGGRCIATDSGGNVYVTGWFRAPSIVVGTTTLYNKNPAGGTSDMFLIKYDPNGNVLWAKSAGSSDDEKGNGCIVDAMGNVIVTGYCNGDSIDIEGVKYLNNGGKDAFIIKYSANGTLLAAKVYGGSSSDESYSCSTDAAGNVFISGWFSSSSLTFDTHTVTNTNGGSDIFLIKLDTSLNTLWAVSAGSSSDDEARACATDIYGNTAIAGVFKGPSITLGNTVLNNNGGEEIFLAKYDTDGSLFWAKKIGKSKDDGANDCAINNNGRIVIAGYYNSSSLTLGNIQLDNSYVGVSTSDVFIANTCDTQKGTDTQTACGPFTWIDGNTYTTNNNVAIYNLPAGAANTCDSMVTLNLTIETVDVSITTAAQDITANATGATYQWLDCDNNFAVLPGETSQTFTAVSGGNYAVEVTQHSCTDTSECVFITALGVLNNHSPHATIIYPNPNSGMVNFIFGTANGVTLNVFNTSGQLIFQKENIQAKTYQLELKESAGIYFAEVIFGGEKHYHKLIVKD